MSFSTDRKILGYRFFKSNEEFTEWQLQNPKFAVHNIQPSPSVMSSAGVSEEGAFDAVIEAGVFIVYSWVPGGIDSEDV